MDERREQTVRVPSSSTRGHVRNTFQCWHTIVWAPCHMQMIHGVADHVQHLFGRVPRLTLDGCFADCHHRSDLPMQVSRRKDLLICCVTIHSVLSYGSLLIEMGRCVAIVTRAQRSDLHSSLLIALSMRHICCVCQNAKWTIRMNTSRCCCVLTGGMVSVGRHGRFSGLQSKSTKTSFA
jgi:hypothetical protein